MRATAPGEGGGGGGVVASGVGETKMTLRLVSILSVALISVLPAQLDAFITQNTGCHHNGTWYADKSVVPSMEKCLNCQCNRKTLVCRLKVCPEMPMPPPRGCVVVQKKNSCCPYLSCARLDAFYKIPTKRRIIAYLDHYERESIDRVVNDNMLQRRSDDSDVDLFVCVKNGTVYKSGSAMSSSNLCSYCYCIGGSEKCVKPKCMLPVEGCKPIFVDSTCCPVRYDCSSKTSGKSSQEVRYRKNSNKHFQRMSQRLQRNRGCTVGAQFYAEGQKMRSDADRPCDICFCIRGTRRCAPKKCAPALKNCIPVVPKGQCCPSSYDCGSQRDYRRSQSSRQFNLYNLLFGKEEQEAEAAAASVLMPQNTMAEHYPLDRHPTEPPVGDALQASSEKSILDTLREGLEFIDGNNNQMLANNMDLAGLPSTATPQPLASPPATEVSSTTELSFLDLLLGPSTEREANPMPESTTAKKPLSWVDLLLGPDEEDLAQADATVTEAFVETTTGLTQPVEAPLASTTMRSIERIADDFDDHLADGEIAVGELPAEAQQIAIANAANWPRPKDPLASTTAHPADLFNVLLDGLSVMLDGNISSTSTTTTTTTTRQPIVTHAPPMFRPLPSNKPQHTRINSKLANLTVSPPMVVVTSKYGQPVTYRTMPGRSTTSSTTTTTTTTAKPTTTSKVGSTTTRPTTTTTRRPTTTTTKSKPKTTRRTTTTTSQPTTTTSSTTTTTTTPKPKTAALKTTFRPPIKHKQPPYIITSTTTTVPLIIKTNPSILEAEPLDDGDSTAPTLPPSLPNLKIIPFLPTDAVDSAPKIPPPESFNSHSYYQQPLAADKMGIDYDSPYAEPPQHPNNYNSHNDQAAYKYKFNVEVPAAEAPPEPVVHVGGQYEGSSGYVKYDFKEQVVQPPVHSGFSPPTETEGGFMPKEPLVIDGEVLQEHVTSNVLLSDNYHVTQHIIDITTERDDNDTASIEITTPDPFKDVIHTERPPNLDTLIEDKKPTQEQLQQQQQQHVESVTNSISSSSGFKAAEATAAATAAAAPSTTPTAPATTTTTTTKQTPLIDKNEINKLDELLDELLGMNLPSLTHSSSSTVPPFKTLPTRSTELPSTAATATNAKVTTATSTARPLATPTAARGHKKGNKTKQKPSGNRRQQPTTITTKPARYKGQAATRRTPASNSSSNSNGNSSMATAAQTSTKTKSTSATTTTTTATTTTPKPHTTISTTATAATTTTTAATTAAAATIASSTVHPFLMSPFDKLPFMDTSYEVRPHQKQQQQQQLQLLAEQQRPQQFHHYQHAPSSSSTTTTTMATPAGAASGAAADANLAGGGGAGDGLMDPTGMLKLAGCNIYGRMYRVGRIIVELSNQCLECKCTEVGVKCGPLDC
ncbi:mucin-5AC [Drosophila montana]|uniref:mucin-5AC n=1 Tax=Drosophila montana TaxID=40370 RepID=UPI00313B7F7F